MSDIVVDRNQRFDAVAKLAASANSISTPEQLAILGAIEVQLDAISGDIGLELEMRRIQARKAAAESAAAQTAARLKRGRKKKTASAKVLRKRSR